MQLCLVRHGIAVDRDAAGVAEDAQRPLTAEGKERMEAGAAGLRRLFDASAIVSSPLVRARQTAEIVQQQQPGATLTFDDTLASGDHDALLAPLRQPASAGAILVGHEPHMSGLLSYLLTGDSYTLHVEFKKGAAAIVDIGEALEPGTGTLVAFLPPKALRALR